MILRFCHNIESDLRMAKAKDSSNVPSDYFKTLPDDCRKRYVKKIGRIIGLNLHSPLKILYPILLHLFCFLLALVHDMY